MSKEDLREIMKRKCCHRSCKEKPIAIVYCKYYCRKHSNEIKYPKGRRVATGPVY